MRARARAVAHATVHAWRDTVHVYKRAGSMRIRCRARMLCAALWSWNRNAMWSNMLRRACRERDDKLVRDACVQVCILVFVCVCVSV
jgi:hypothetical protein